MNKFLLIASSFLSVGLFAQSYAPAAGQPGSTAIHFSDNQFTSWATSVEVQRGFVNIEDTTIEAMGDNRASFGDPTLAIGSATTDPADVVSLGDKGWAIVQFEQPIINGPGSDFAVFENSFSDTYLELAHVEVSSNGVDFVRFPSHSEVQDEVQIHGFGATDPTMINNLAGKYRGGYGTPFDLEELTGISSLDVNNITHIKIIDVVGSVGDSATFDSFGNKINEPFSTPYESGGFDLDAVGVIHQALNINDEKQELALNIFPNPARESININLSNSIEALSVYDNLGRIVYHENDLNTNQLQLSFPPNLYFIHLHYKGQVIVKKIIFIE
jgi:hypothetical protein